MYPDGTSPLPLSGLQEVKLIRMVLDDASENSTVLLRPGRTGNNHEITMWFFYYVCILGGSVPNRHKFIKYIYDLV